MALNIKDPETDRLARELASVTGESITEAARRAFAERLDRVRARAQSPSTHGTLAAIVQRGRERQILDERTAESILGYDEDGLPQ